MDITRLSQIVFAEGFVENFIEASIESATDEDKAIALSIQWQTLVAGLRELRRENQVLETKLMLAKQAVE
jgi:hypothetical protein